MVWWHLRPWPRSVLDFRISVIVSPYLRLWSDGVRAAVAFTYYGATTGCTSMGLRKWWMVIGYYSLPVTPFAFASMVSFRTWNVLNMFELLLPLMQNDGTDWTRISSYILAATGAQCTMWQVWCRVFFLFHFMVVVDAWSACVVSPNGVRDLSVLFTQCIYIYIWVRWGCWSGKVVQTMARGSFLSISINKEITAIL